MPDLPTPAKHVQSILFNVGKQVEYDGVEMSVLENVITYLTESGLARMCGTSRQTLSEIASEWENKVSKPRLKIICIYRRDWTPEPAKLNRWNGKIEQLFR